MYTFHCSRHSLFTIVRSFHLKWYRKQTPFAENQSFRTVEKMLLYQLFICHLLLTLGVWTIDDPFFADIGLMVIHLLRVTNKYTPVWTFKSEEMVNLLHCIIEFLEWNHIASEKPSYTTWAFCTL